MGSIKGYSVDTAWFQGEHGTVHSLPLMSKGEEKDKRKSISINDKRGYCWKCFFTDNVDLSLMESTVVMMA